MMPSVTDYTRRALRKLGLKDGTEQLEAYEAQDGLHEINLILESWTNDVKYSNGLNVVNFTLSQGVEKYTIGPTGDFVTNKPEEILLAYTRDNTGTEPIDYPIKIVTFQEYQELSLKEIATYYPTKMWYNPTQGDGEIYLYPQPDRPFELYLTLSRSWTKYNDPGDLVTLPSGYGELLEYELASRLSDYYPGSLSAEMKEKHAKADDKVKSNNTKVHRRQMKFSVPCSRRGRQSSELRTYMPNGIGPR